VDITSPKQQLRRSKSKRISYTGEIIEEDVMVTQASSDQYSYSENSSKDLTKMKERDRHSSKSPSTQETRIHPASTKGKEDKPQNVNIERQDNLLRKNDDKRITSSGSLTSKKDAVGEAKLESFTKLVKEDSQRNTGNKSATGESERRKSSKSKAVGKKKKQKKKKISKCGVNGDPSSKTDATKSSSKRTKNVDSVSISSPIFPKTDAKEKSTKCSISNSSEKVTAKPKSLKNQALKKKKKSEGRIESSSSISSKVDAKKILSKPPPGQSKSKKTQGSQKASKSQTYKKKKKKKNVSGESKKTTKFSKASSSITAEKLRGQEMIGLKSFGSSHSLEVLVMQASHERQKSKTEKNSHAIILKKHMSDSTRNTIPTKDSLSTPTSISSHSLKLEHSQEVHSSSIFKKRFSSVGSSPEVHLPSVLHKKKMRNSFLPRKTNHKGDWLVTSDHPFDSIDEQVQSNQVMTVVFFDTTNVEGTS
jgi:hypothetical protein